MPTQPTYTPYPTATDYPTSTPYPITLPAFPGAEGFGANSVGGRGGRVIEVTNLNDSGPGSLRACIEAGGPRICIFRVGGTIEVKSELRIRESYLTIAGQTAPGGGILIKSSDAARGRAFWIGGGTQAVHDVVIRYLRIRLGKHGDIGGKTGSAISIRPPIHDVIIDHCSVSWAADKNFDAWFSDSVNQGLPFRNITYQRNIISESLKDSTGQNIGGEMTTLSHLKINNTSIHHNLYVGNSHRNPCTFTGGTEVINNVVYNWAWSASQTYGGVSDFVGNYYRPGPMRPNSAYGIRYGIHDPADGSIYVKGNLHTLSLTEPDIMDNWQIVCDSETKPLSDAYRRMQPLPDAPIPVTVHDAQNVYDNILGDVGANTRLDALGNFISNYDAVDKRLMEEMAMGSGITSQPIDEFEAGGHPHIEPGIPYDDTDHDGIADAWELAHFGNLSRSSANDSDGDGYTDLEEFLNGTQP